MKLRSNLRTSLPATLFALALTFGLGCGSDPAPALDGGAGRGGSGGRGGTTGVGGTGGGTTGGTGGATTGGTGGAAAGGRGGSTGGTGGAAAGGRGGAGGGAGTTGGTGGAAVGGRGGAGGGAGTTGGTGGAAVGGRGGAGGGAGTTGGTGGGAAGTTGGTGGGAAGTTGGTGGGAAGGTGGAAGTAGPDGGTDASDGPTCQNECTLAATRCGAGGGVQTCVAGSSGCTVWGTAAACPGVQICAGGACSCPAAPAGCGAAGTNCLNGAIVTCTPDAQGCLAASSAACPTRTACTGSAGTAACTCVHECAAVGSFCSDADTVGTCANDGNSCRFVSGTSPCVGVATCSGGACVCPGPVAVPVAGGACAMAVLGTTACAGTDILTCVNQTGSNCPIWEVSTPCGPSGLTCGIKAGPPACECPANAGTTVYVDPVAGANAADATHPYPTGIQNPPQCRYATLTMGLATVGSPGTVTAISAAAVAFDTETFPIAVPANVTLRTIDSTPTPANYRINFDDGAAGAAVTLGAGASLQGFSLVADAGVSATADLVSCSAGSVTLNGLELRASAAAATGVHVVGACSATLLGVTAESATVAALDVASTGAVTASGGLLFDSAIGVRQTDGTVTLNGVDVHANTQAGIRLTGGALPSLVTVNSQVRQTDSGVGIDIATGSLAALTTTVTGNSGAGIVLASGASIMHTLGTVTASTNGGAGVAITNGIVTATGLIAIGNGANGVTVGTGSTVTLNNAQVNTNLAGGSGLAITAGAVTVSGGQYDGNSVSGIVAAAGTLTITGNPSLGGNGRGLGLLGATAVVSSANIHDNTGDGILIDSAAGVPITIGVTGASPAVVINANQRDGIRILRSPTTPSAANSVTLETLGVTSNSGIGINLLASAGGVATTIRNSGVSANGGTGIVVAGAPTTTVIQNNNVTGNNTGGGAADNIGGILFDSPSTLSSFIGNRIHSNGGDELGFSAAAVGSFTLGNGACGDGANQLYCYGTGNVGLRIIGATTVNAANTHWSSANPANGLDYSLGAGSATVSPACAAITACP